MLAVVLFGAGRCGSIWHIEKYDRVINVPDCVVRVREMVGGIPVRPDVEYQVFEYQMDNEIYLVGLNGDRPSNDVISSHIRHGNPELKPFKVL